VELRQLEMLQAVVKCGGYKRAGEKLNLSHPAIHRQIRLLEHELNQPVFRRSGRRVQLTEAGQRLVALAGRVQRDVSQVLSEIRDLEVLDSGSLRVGTATTMLMFFLPRVIQCFGRKHPNVQINISTSTVSEIFDRIENGRLDLGVAFVPIELHQDRPPIGQELLYEEEFVLAVSSSHPLSRRRVVTPEDLRNLPLITYAEGSTMRQFLELRLHRVGIEPRILMELENEETISKLLESGIGAAFVSHRRAVADGLHHLCIRGLPLRCRVCLVYPKRGYMSRAAREFARLCREECNR
jgi:DNA-binding transcriptional LysR family regulator